MRFIGFFFILVLVNCTFFAFLCILIDSRKTAKWVRNIAIFVQMFSLFSISNVDCMDVFQYCFLLPYALWASSFSFWNKFEIISLFWPSLVCVKIFQSFLLFRFLWHQMLYVFAFALRITIHLLNNVMLRTVVSHHCNEHFGFWCYSLFIVQIIKWTQKKLRNKQQFFFVICPFEV